MKRRGRWFHHVSFIGALIVMLTLGLSLMLQSVCLAAGDSDLVEKAKKEGKTVWYTSLSITVAEEIAKRFESKYPGIKVEIIRSGTERIYNRFLQEQSAGINVADTINTSNVGHYAQMKREGSIIPYYPPGIKNEVFFPNASDPDGTWFTAYSNILLIAWNTDKVERGSVPKTWGDVINDQWKGKIVMAHPGYSGYALTLMNALVKMHGMDFYKRIKPLNPMIVQSSLDTVRTIITGERLLSVGAPFQLAFDKKRSKAPVDFLIPKEGGMVTISPSAVLKKAPHPNAGKLFHGFYLSRDTQLFTSAKGYYSLRKDIEWDDRPSLQKSNLIFPDPAVKRNELIKAFRDTLGI